MRARAVDRSRRRRHLLLAVLSAVVAATMAGCMSDPPPPVRETEAPPQTPAEYPTEKTIYVATDSVGQGFNPHLAADQSTVTTAIASMTLPSAFEPVQTPDGVVWQRSEALLTSAEVTSQQPFTVTYKIHTNAQWSDGLPVTGDDFSYLWQQMSRQPNVVAPAGYRLIDSVESSSGGKVVTVKFARAYPAWREMFTWLLPSHVLKGAPAGFQTGMDSGKPVSAGPFSVFSIDTTRDEVRLIRNDRFWVKPSILDQVVLRRAGTASQMVESVRSGDSSLATLATGPASSAELAAVPGIATQRSATSRALSISVNARTPVMNSVAVRRAILGMIDPAVVTYAGAGDTIVTPYANTVLAPSDPGYFAVDRQRPSVEQIDELLGSAGYRRGAPTPTSTPPAGSSVPSSAPATSSVSPSSGAPSSSTAPVSPSSSTPPDPASTMSPVPDGVAGFSKDGRDLAVRVGAISGDARSTAAAANIVDQLRNAGVRAAVVSLPNNELYGVALTESRVDMAVGWTGLGVPPAAALASQVDCDQPKPGTAPSLSTPPTPTSDAPDQQQQTSTQDVYASNPSGVCDNVLIGLARDALSSDNPLPQLTEAEPLLAAQSIYLPLYQDSMMVGVTRKVTRVPLSGPIQVSIFGTASTWNLS